MTRTVISAAPLGAVDEGNIVPQIAVGNAILELRMMTCYKLVGFADLQRRAAAGACAAEGLRVLGSSGDVNRGGGVALVDAPEPDVVGTAVANVRVANCGGKTGLQGGGEKD